MIVRARCTGPLAYGLRCKTPCVVSCALRHGFSVQGGGSSRSGSRSPSRSVSDRDGSGSERSGSSDDAIPQRRPAASSPFALRLPGVGGAANGPAVPKLGIQEIDSATRHTTQEQVRTAARVAPVKHCWSTVLMARCYSHLSRKSKPHTCRGVVRELTSGMRISWSVTERWYSLPAAPVRRRLRRTSLVAVRARPARPAGARRPRGGGAGWTAAAMAGATSCGR